MEKYKQQVKTYFNKYNQQAVIALRKVDSVVIASPQKDMEIVDLNSNSEGINAVITATLKAKKDINAIIISGLKYTKIVSQTKAVIPPLLDDLAQIVGPSVKCAQLSSKDIKRKLSGRNACTVEGEGAFAIGRTLDEADTATKVLEKGSKAFIESTMIGGAKPIRKFEAVLMHIIYKKKYSKLDQTNKIKEMQND